MRKSNDKADVSILYFRPANRHCTALDGKLFELASRNRSHARLVVKHTDEHGYLFGGWVSGRAPTVLFVRDGEMIAQFIGDLPAHEIEGLLRSALRSATRDSADSLARSAS
jgi:thioredoxin-like negative regulator of GroEL